MNDTMCVVLAGGRSSRFGSNKAFAKFRGKEMVSRVLDVMSAVFNDVVIVTNRPLEYEGLGFKVIKDIIPCKGPMAGVITALHCAEKVFVCACDMPFVDERSAELIAVSSEGSHDAVVARTALGPEPLFALYKKVLLGRFEKALCDGRGSIMDVLRESENITYIDIDEKIVSSINTVEEMNAIL